MATWGEEAGKLCCFFPESVKFDRELGSPWERGQGWILESWKNNRAIGRNGEVVRKSHFKEENDELAMILFI